MVSTTLTAIAAGQTTSSSSNYHHHHQSSNATGTASASSTTNSNSNYQKAQSQLHQQHQHNQPPLQNLSSLSTSTQAVTATSTGGTNARNSYYNNYIAYTLKGNEELHTGNLQSTNEYIENTDDVDHNLSHQYQQRPTSALRHERGSENQVIKEESSSIITGESEIQTTKTQRNEIVTLSQSLLTSSSSPLNDQISLLFPKCRPKHTTSNGNNKNNNNSNSSNISDTTAVENLNNDSIESDIYKNVGSVFDASSPTESYGNSFKSETVRSPPIKVQAGNRNYYRSVNIITQSPPPPSTSSVSSESLSSVTPRISTNPFLCPADENETSKLNEEDEKSFHEDLPIPTYRTFYYHTSTTNNGGNIQQQPHNRPQINQQHLSLDEDEDRSYEMPRKRNNYNSSFHSTQSSFTPHVPQTSLSSADNQRHNQFRQQQQQFLQYNGTVGDIAQSSIQPNPNPFMRDNYWESAATSRLSHHQTPSKTMLDSPETELPPPIYGATSTTKSKSLRRNYHQQGYNNSIEQQQARPLHSSPINESIPTKFNESNKITENPYVTDQSLMKSCSEAHMPLVSRYVQGARANGNTITNIKERVREQDSRDKRDVGQCQQPNHQQKLQQQQKQQQQQQQKQQQQQQLRQQHQTPHSVTEGRFSMISNGEVVVFDDINESWQNLKVTTDTNAPALSPIAQNGVITTSSSMVIQQNTMTVMDVNGEGNAKSNLRTEEEINILGGQKKNQEKSNLSASIDARHGIMEYEGSPRRIGHSGNTPEDERMPTGNIQSQNATRTSINYNNISSSFNSNSPQQQYPARPGFPQRIMSPPRESNAAAIFPIQSNNMKHHTQHFQMESHAAVPQMVQQMQQSSADTNAEDTSNDVSEIGTISDLTTPEVMSTAATLPTINQESIQISGTTPTGQLSTLTTTTPNTGTSALTIPTKSSTFDYLYEFSETRKVLEEFFKCPSIDEKVIEDSSDIDSVDIQYEFHSNFDRDDDDPIEAEGEEEDDEEEDEHPEVENNANDGMQIDAQQQIQQKSHFYHHPQQEQQQSPQQQQQKLQRHQPALQTLPRYQFTKPQQQQQQAKLSQEQSQYTNQRRRFTGSPLMRDFDSFLDSASRSSGEQNEQQDGINHNQQQDGRNNYRYSPETTDYDSNCGDLDSLSGEMNGVSTTCSNYAKFYASSMPVLEDGLSSGHTSDTENNNKNNFNSILQQQTNSGIHHTAISGGNGGISVLMDMKRVPPNGGISTMNNISPSTAEFLVTSEKYNSVSPNGGHQRKLESPISSTGMGILDDQIREYGRQTGRENHIRNTQDRELLGQSPTNIGSSNKVFKNIDPDLDALYSINVFHRTDLVQMTPPPPAPAPHRKPNTGITENELNQAATFTELRSGTTTTSPTPTTSIASAISSTLNRNRNNVAQSNCLPLQQANQLHNNTNRSYQTQQPPPIPERTIQRSPSPTPNSPVWLPRHLDNSASKSLLETSSGNLSKNQSADEDDIDTDLETDRLLGHQRLDDQGYYDENKTWERNKSRSLLSKISPKQQIPSTKTRNGYNALLSSTPEIPPPIPPKNSSNKLLDISGSISSPDHSDKSPMKSRDVQECVVAMSSPGGSNNSGRISGNMKKDTEGMNNTNNGMANNGLTNGSNSNSSTSGNESIGNVGLNHANGEKKVKKSKNKEGGAVLIEGVLFRAKYLGSTQLVCEGQPTKSTRMMQAEEAVSRIKAPDSDVQPSTEVDLFISTEKIMVLNTDLKEIMMDHALRTISYIADIGDLVVLMARRRFVPQDIDDAPKPNRTPKMICHVFESDEAQFIAQSIGQAFQVAYMEFLKANGIEDHSFVKEMDYQEVLNSQEIFGDELEIFAKKELQKEVVVPKAKGEILGVVIVESGWGSMLPTVVIANLMSSGAAARCGQLNIGDQLIAINGLSLVGLPLSTCQNYIKNTKNQTVVKFTVVPCPPVVEVKIKRPNTKYQLGFSVQNGVICSLLRGGIAERGGVRVGHRIIEINNQSVVAVPHEKIVNLLATSVGEILMKTMPTSMFRLLTGQETPIYI